LHGDSITDWWVQGDENKAMFEKYFGGIRTANFAVAGDTTQGVLWGLHNGEGQGFQPKAIMLMIGTNNTSQNTAPEIAEGIGAVVLEMRRDFPDAKILLLAIFPRSLPTDAAAHQDRGDQLDHREAGRSEARVLYGHRIEVSGRQRRVPARFVPPRTTCTRRPRVTTSGARP
jgi:lysophospholipase L1-like esterase